MALHRGTVRFFASLWAVGGDAHLNTRRKIYFELFGEIVVLMP